MRLIRKNRDPSIKYEVVKRNVNQSNFYMNLVYSICKNTLLNRLKMKYLLFIYIVKCKLLLRKKINYIIVRDYDVYIIGEGANYRHLKYEILFFNLEYFEIERIGIKNKLMMRKRANEYYDKNHILKDNIDIMWHLKSATLFCFGNIK